MNETLAAMIDMSSNASSPTSGPNTTDDHVSAEEEIWKPAVIQRVASLVIIMILTLIGNVAIIIVLSRSNYRKRNNRVNIFIINLAIGDLTVCFATMTTEILFVCFGEWVLGAFGCKFVTYIQGVTLSSTTFILTTMGFDRYMAICRPLRFSSSPSRARKMILISWILGFILALPQLLIFVQTVDGEHPDKSIKYGCKSQGYTAQWQRKVYITFMAVYILVFPAITISFCYINVARVVWKQGKADTYIKCGENNVRRFIVNKGVISLAKIKTIKMTFCIILTFLACWTPYFVTTLCLIYSDRRLNIPGTVMAFAETVALLQSAVNPILYGIFNIKLIRGLKEVFCPDRLTKKRVNSLANYNAVRGFYCYTSEERRQNTLNSLKNNTVNSHKNVNIRSQERLSRPASSSSDASTDRPHSSTNRSHGCIIAESNKNGFRLRVRFMSKEVVHIHDRHGRCLYPASKTDEGEKMECKL